MLFFDTLTFQKYISQNPKTTSTEKKRVPFIGHSFLFNIIMK